ncbi:putative cyclin [Lupinus albus]|uniref:Putative cyclin n=1 Tax=Lupinus albus TaxID=3870 RepID=A0A6A4NC79_LUPAL|nr:putative cyclin [Lupinus albus]
MDFNYANTLCFPSSFYQSICFISRVFAIRCTLNKTPIWNETLKLHTSYSEEQLMDCAKLLVSFHSTIGGEKLKILYRKYSVPQRGVVAVLSPAKNLI